MPLFNFHLENIVDIHPWGDNPPSLSWFPLTSGWFWIDIGGQQLFRYSQEILDHWAQGSPPDVSKMPFTDYPIVRYWEDLFVMVPSILDPLPDDLALRVSDADAWGQWRERAIAWQETSDDESVWDIYYKALRWWGSRTWDSIHLNVPPVIWLWSVDEQVHIRWDCRDIMLDGAPVWEARYGEICMPKSEFLDEVRSFSHRLLAEMAIRIQEIRTNEMRPDVVIDIDSVEREQKIRATACENVLSHIHHERDYEWDDVRAAMAHIDAKLEGARIVV